MDNKYYYGKAGERERGKQGVYKSSLTNFQEISRTHLTNFQ